MTDPVVAPGDSVGWLGPAFLISGAAALIYQVVWQRVLFATFGINIEAVTLVVTAFLVGLGLGSAIGGSLSASPSRRLLRMFALFELAVGSYGAISVQLFRNAGSSLIALPPIGTAVVTFLLVLVPTVGMGATLPLLVAHGVRSSGNVGRSVGVLYFVNTAGSALAAILCVLLLLGRFGEEGSVRIAATANACVGTFALLRDRRERGDSTL
jgi:hypothetical protein